MTEEGYKSNFYSYNNVHKVTILPYGKSLGHTAILSDNDSFSLNKYDIIKFIGRAGRERLMTDVAIGARALEELMLGNGKITSGCSSDLRKATQLAYQYVIRFGMDDEDGNLVSHGQMISNEDVVPHRKYMPNLSEEDHFKIDTRANNLILDRLSQAANCRYQEVKKILSKNLDNIKPVVRELVAKETLTAEDLDELMHFTF